MPAAVTHNIRVSVISRFEPGQGSPEAGRFVFSYRITIANRSKETVQLLARHWVITDSLAPRTEVQGPGVVGEQPVLAPGEQYTYTSYCELNSNVGSMEGSYLMRNVADHSEFEVLIPSFTLQLPHTAN
ncbi:MAG: Co2+/Mg2+ efflux protein ApaG [Flavobacteriales bacterium]|nr:Co2+/Mg2+ efflux protein ApaG [Flavobacteriales bacterium]